MIDGTASQPFSAITMPLKENSESYKGQIIIQSRKSYREDMKVAELIREENSFEKDKGIQQQKLL